MDKVLIVTGASRGIGAATALGAAKAGYRVVVNYAQRREEADGVVRDIAKGGGTAVAIQADVGLEADVMRLFAETDRLYGGLDGLVNNAGVVGHSTRFVDMATADLHRVFAINVFGSFLCAREAVRRMSTSRGGR